MAVPTDYSNLELWLKSDAGTWQDTAGTTAASADNDPIARWDDQSGNARHATQATSANRPAVSTTTTLNSIRSVNFDRTTTPRRLDLPNFMSAFTAGEAFSVTRLRSATPADIRTAYWRFGNEAAGGNVNSHIRWTDGLTYERFGTTVRKESVAISASENLANWFVYDVWSASNDYAILTNGWPYYVSGINTVGFTTTPQIGALASDPNFGFDGWWQELIFYSRKLSAAERSGIYGYITSRYSIAGTAQVTRLAGITVANAIPTVRATRLAGLVVGSPLTPARVTRLAGIVVASRTPLATAMPPGMTWFIG